MTKRIYMLFSAAAYTIFLGTFLYLIAFLSGLPFVPLNVDSGGADAPVWLAAIVDLALITLFGTQHSVMARPGFKRFWSRFVAAPVERSVYVLLASLVLILLFTLWRPIGGDVWRIENPLLQTLVWALFASGWAIVLLSTFLINHFELFGLQQAWFNLREKAAAAPQFRTPLLYKIVRHPLYAGFFIAFWAAPRMTVGHLLFAAGMSAYMLIAIVFEERDLVAHFGAEYRRYQEKVGKLLPRLAGR